jgi:ribosomal protein L33
MLKVVVDMDATVNTISYGMLVDHQLEDRIRLNKPLGVGTSEYSEHISINWMGKGNGEHGTSKFYILRRSQTEITDRVILAKYEWLKRRSLLYNSRANTMI